MALDLAPNSLVFFLSSLYELLFIIIPLIVFHYQKKDLKQEFKTHIVPQPRSIQKRLMDIIGGMGLGYLFIPMANISHYTIYQITIALMGEDFYHTASSGSINTSPPTMTSLEIVLTVMMMFVLVGFAEEFLFRGVLMHEFQKKGIGKGIVLSAFLFAIYHVFPGIVPWATFITFWPFYFLFGLVLGGITTLNKGDLLMAIIAHGTYNSILYIAAYT